MRRIVNELLRWVHGISIWSAPLNCAAVREIGTIDMFICDMHVGEDRGAELVATLRGMKNHVNNKIPVLLTCSHIRKLELKSSRDCGANMLLAKPFSVSALYDRLAWIAHKPRPFVWADGYKGPDRRFKDEELTQEDRRQSEAENMTKGAAS